ncbi:Hypothetical_protein [Hexamita inflata]|uniref:Hypothetical_protein n=1 Tax=Hexamita inflata TaxID=28002 RepID=A0AA86RGF5_9EUKA|nr:Hypothetical protein HINF_LOCUS65015 [Hexamita inflata]
MRPLQIPKILGPISLSFNQNNQNTSSSTSHRLNQPSSENTQEFLLMTKQKEDKTTEALKKIKRLFDYTVKEINFCDQLQMQCEVIQENIDRLAKNLKFTLKRLK